MIPLNQNQTFRADDATKSSKNIPQRDASCLSCAPFKDTGARPMNIRRGYQVQAMTAPGGNWFCAAEKITAMRKLVKKIAVTRNVDLPSSTRTN